MGSSVILPMNLSQIREMVSHKAHNLEIIGSTPVSATNRSAADIRCGIYHVGIVALRHTQHKYNFASLQHSVAVSHMRRILHIERM